ncbi:SAM-dependent methyltransferase [Amycolatopsis sp. A1MSW2902]
MPALDQNHGEVFTRRWVVDVLLDLVGYDADRDLGELRLVEPSCGTGAFLRPAVERLIRSAQNADRDLRSLDGAIRAYDLQPGNVRAARLVCRDLLAAAGASAPVAAGLARSWVRRADFLLDDDDDREADFAVGNPPYIRYDDLSNEVAVKYRTAWQTMRGRGDIYVGFFERCLSILKADGKVGFICADRWMRNQYGAALRELVSREYSVEQVWTMHGVDAFEEKVSAYPAITVIANKAQGPVVVADMEDSFSENSAKSLVKWSTRGRSAAFSGPGVKAHRLPHWFGGSDLWPTGTPARLALVEHLNDRYYPLHDPENTGTRVSIGVATGADKVYITKDGSAVESDRILPMAMSGDLMSGNFEWQGNYLINPWSEDGSLVELEDYPQMSEYFSRHPQLRTRHVAKKAPARWYRTIDKVHADLLARPKLLLQDMKSAIHPVYEPGGFYPHHNLYYIVSDIWDLEVLGGLLLSRVSQAFIEAYCVRMRGGTLRFQAQYLKKIRVPRPSSLDRMISAELKSAFRSRDTEAATRAAAKVYEIDLEEYELLSAGKN